MTTTYRNKNGVVSKTGGRLYIDNLANGDAGTEATPRQASSELGGVFFFVNDLELDLLDQLVYKVIVPPDYIVGSQLKLRLFCMMGMYNPGGGAGSTHTFTSSAMVLSSGGELWVNYVNNTGQVLTNTVGDSKFEVYESVIVSDATGKINSVPVAIGDLIAGKLTYAARSHSGTVTICALELIWG